MNAPRSRQYRRVAQACDNCRRKKIRCPGERPRCSACTRLRQQCSFSDSDYMSEESASRIESRMSSRLEQLEDKLDSLISRVVPPSIDDITPSSNSSGNNRMPSSLSYSSTARHPSPPSSTFLPVEVIARAIEFYFQHIHRQPLWLFEKHSISHSDACEDLLNIILALSITYSPEEFSDDNLKSPDFYSKAARRDVMLKIAEGRMAIRSTQTLCLLSYFSFISGDVAMAGFDTALAKNMTQLLAAGNQSSQEMSKLFWSIQYLSLTCGAPALVPFISDDINTPHFLSLDARDPLAACLPAPRATESGFTGSFADIWSHSLKICNLWTDIRLYVAKCIEGVAKCPWQPDSDYTRLCSQLLEVEMLWPNALSYNSVGFSNVPPRHVQTDHLNWLPWLRGQVTYHAFHCILNHPFLYTLMAKTPTHRLGANTFWRSSYEKALRHSTWISRLIRAAGEKGLRLTDPFFAQAAAIASTLLLYWTRSSDCQVQASCLENLEICKKLVTDMAACWPVCRTIDDALNQFVEFIDPPTHLAHERTSSTAAKTSLIWTLLDVAASQFPNYSDQSLRGREAWNGRSGTDENPEIPRSEMSSPPTDMRESTAHYASPPAWFQAGTDPEQGEDAESLAHQVATSDRTLAHDLAWGPWENLGPIGENFCLNMDWWDINQF